MYNTNKLDNQNIAIKNNPENQEEGKNKKTG